jgi:NDP-sugar pyrophosphorylase family protein
MQTPAGPQIKPIISKGCHSFGDAMREIDSHGFIRSDPFVLCSLDVVSNVNLRPIIAHFQ